MAKQRDSIPRGNTEDIAKLVDKGRHEAFHGSPLKGIEPLLLAVAMARANADGESLITAEWLLGVCYSASGDYARALEALEPQVDLKSEQLVNQSQGFASVTIASIYRQVGEHHRAEDFDQWARILGAEDVEVDFEAKLGLTADAIGMGNLKLAKQRLRGAANVDRKTLGWRSEVRLNWVSCELSLLDSNPKRAIEFASLAVSEARSANAPRHIAKSLLFLGASYLTAGELLSGARNARRNGVRNLRESVEIAEHVGATPLVWPSRVLLASTKSGLRKSDREKQQVQATAAIRRMAGGMSSEMGKRWLASLKEQGIELN